MKTQKLKNTDKKQRIINRILLCLALPLWTVADLTVASLNPIVSDLARQIGGEHVKVVELMRAGENPHIYEPSPMQLRQANTAALFMAAGKGLESYLPDLRDTLGRDKRILEVGEKIPSLKMSHSELFVCCPGHHHSHNAIDPHWWHSIKNLRMAARIIEETFAELDKTNQEYYKTRRSEYVRQLYALEKWVKKEIYRIPRRERILTTAHTAFSYFCHDFGFKAVPIQGLSTEVDAEPQHLASVIETIRRERIRAVFPEKNVNPKLLETVIKETGVRVGGYLLTGSPEPENPTVEAMFRHNVETIVNALISGNDD